MRLINLILLIILFHSEESFSTPDANHLTCEFSDTKWEPLDSVHLYTCDIFTKSIDSPGYKIIFDGDSDKVEGLSFNDNKNMNYLPDNIGETFANLQGLIGVKTYLTVINVGDLKGLRKLKYLNFASSDLKVIEEGVFSDLEQLIEMDLSDSDIVTIHVNAFQGLISLKTLYLGANKLSQIEPKTFDHLISLESLSLELNHFVEIDNDLFVANSKLADIWLNGNKIKSLSWQVFENVKSLSYVDLQNNPCIDGVFDVSNFKDLEKMLGEKCVQEEIEEATLSGNYIAAIKDEFRIDGSLEDGSFSQYIKIIKSSEEEIILPPPENDIATKMVECHMNDLQWRLSNKIISTCEITRQIINAKDFKISGNGNSVKAMSFNNNKHAKYLPKNIEKFAPNLVEFSAMNSSLVLITNKNFADLRHLRSLNLANSNIKFIDPDAFDDLTSLEELDLSGNELEFLDEELFSKLKNLKVLRIGSNKIHEMPKKVLRSLRNLESISMNHQYIPSIDENIFKTNVKLKNIWMNANKFKSISPNIFNPLKSLEYVDLRENKCIDKVYDDSTFSSIKTDILAKCGSGYELKMGVKTEVKATSKKKKSRKEKKKKEKLAKVESVEEKEVTCDYEDIFWPHANRTLRTCVINEIIDDSDFYLSANPKVFENFVDTDKVEAISFANNKNIKFLPQNVGDVFPNLIEMSVANSALTEINPKTFHSMRKLKSLNLSGNELISLPADAFQELSQLEELLLDDNQIEEIDELTFTYLKILRRLRMKGNKFTTFHYSWFDGLSDLHDITFDLNDESTMSIDFFTRHPSLKWISMNGKFYNDKMEVFDYSEDDKTLNPFDFAGIVDEIEEEDYEIEEIECIYGTIGELGEIIENNEVCSIGEDQIIAHRHYVIKSNPKNGAIKKFVIRNNQKVKFLPQNLGQSFPVLESIEIEKTAISSIQKKNFQNLPYLEILNLNGNRIKSFGSDTFDELSFLKELNMRGNKIEILEEGIFHKLPNLRKIDLDENALHYIHPKTFKFLRKLIDVSLNDNQISVIDDSTFKFNSNIEKLSLRGNKIENLSPRTLLTLNKLKFVDLGGNICIDGAFDESEIENVKKALEEKCIKISALSKKIFCEEEENFDDICTINSSQSIESENYTISFDPETHDPTKIQTLKITNNKKVKFLPENIGETFPNLLNFYASNLSLESYPTFENFQNLKVLDLSNNNLKEFNPVGDLSSLEEINLSGNKINFVDDSTFVNLQGLRKIDLSGNELNFITPNAFAHLPRLETLVVDEGDEEMFTDIEYTIIKRIKKKKKLVFEDYDEDSATTQMPGAEVTTIKELTCNLDHHQWNETNPMGILSCVLQNQPIDGPDYKIKSTPTTLFVQELKIENEESVHFLPRAIDESFPKLLRLIARNLSLEEVPWDAFKNLVNLSVIDLSNNNLKSLDPKVFRDLYKLQTLDLSENEIEELPEEIFASLPSLQKINLDGNKITNLSQKMIENLPNLREFSAVGSENGVALAMEDLVIEIETEEPIEFVTRRRSPLTTVTTQKSTFREVNCFKTKKFSSYLNEEVITCDLSHQIIDDPEISISEIPNGENVFSLNMDYNPNINFLPDNIGSLFPNLKEISAKNSALELLLPGDFQNLENLENIELPGNYLKTIEPETFDRLPSLKNLDLHQNQIEFIDEDTFGKLPSLQNLELQNNLISFLNPKAFNNFPNLKSLNIEFNELPSMSEDDLKSLPNLTEFKHNLILKRTTMKPTIRRKEIKVTTTTQSTTTKIETLGNIEEVTTSKNVNVVENITSGSLKPIRKPQNEIECEYGNLYWTNSDAELFTCDLSNSVIVDLNVVIKDSPKNRRVRGLSFVDNKNMKFLPKNIGNYFPNLVEISAYNTSIRKVPKESFKHLPKLKSLNLMVNNIDSVHPNAFNDLISLENLELSDNKIRHLDPLTFKKNPYLKELYLNNNQLHNIDPKLFENLPELRNISLENNKLSSISRKVFNKNYELVNVWLNGNRIKLFDPTTFDGKGNLEYVDLRANECIDEIFQGQSIEGIRNRLKMKCDDIFEASRRNNWKSFESTARPSFEVPDFVPPTRPNFVLPTQPNFVPPTRPNFVLPTRSRSRIPLTTTPSPAKELICRFITRDWPNVSCIIYNQNIDERGYTIQPSSHDPHVTELLIHGNKKVKFLPENIPKIYPNLQNLAAYNNSIIDLFPNNLENLRKLKILDLSNNDLSLIDPEVLKNLPNLEKLKLNSNHIPLIINETFNNLPNLMDLDLSQNDIAEFNPKVFNSLPQLTELSLQNNEIFEIPARLFERNPKLKRINLSGNKINLIDPKAFDNLRNLKEINLGENECVNGDYKEGSLNAMKIDIRKKCKGQNKDEVDSIDPYGYGPNWGVVVPNEIKQPQESIENEIDESWREQGDKDFVECEIVDEFSTIERSNVQTCKIESDKKIEREWKIENSPRTKRVKRFSIDSNPNVYKFPSNLHEAFPELVELEIANTPLKEIHSENFRNLKKLKSLKLPGNSIKFIEANLFENLPNLQNLALNNNNIRHIDDFALSNLPHLTSLDLSNNKLPNFNFIITKNLPKLKSINLSNNDIHSIPFDAFRNNPNIYNIDLSNNNLNSIDPNTFDRLPQLINLDLSKNECIDRKFTASNQFQLKSVLAEHCQSHKSLKNELKMCRKLVENCKKEVKPMELRMDDENLRILLQKSEMKNSQLNLQLKSLQSAFEDEKELHKREIESRKLLELQLKKSCAKIDESHNFLVDLDCDFHENYSCDARNFKVSAENSTIEHVNGAHQRDKRNADVSSFNILNQNTKFLPNEISNFFPNLKILTIDNSQLSKISKIPFNSLPRLTQLSINNNHIRHIDPTSFDDLPHLEKLDLSKNYIKDLPQGVFEKLPKLRELYLADNSLTALPQDIVPKVNNLESFTANNNQFNFIDPRLLKKLKHTRVIDLRNGNCIDEYYENGSAEIVRLIGEISLHCINEDDESDEGFCKGRN